MHALRARAVVAVRRLSQGGRDAGLLPSRTTARWSLQTGISALEPRCLPFVGLRCFSGASDGAAAEAAGSSEQSSNPSLPRVLFTAPPLTKQFATTETDIGWSAVATGSGLGFALLGIAPFTPPNPYMAGFFLAILQVRLAHVWMTRQLRAQTRRHVLEVKHLEGSLDDTAGTVVVQLTCDGNLTRTLRLGPPADNKVSIAEVLKKGCTFVYLDEAMGTVVDAQALQALRLSERVIVKEDFKVKPYEDEQESEAQKTIQSLGQLDAAHLNKLAGRDEVSPNVSLSNIQRSARLSGAVILSSGVVGFLGGRYAAEQATASSAAPPPPS